MGSIGLIWTGRRYELRGLSEAPGWQWCEVAECWWTRSVSSAVPFVHHARGEAMARLDRARRSAEGSSAEELAPDQVFLSIRCYVSDRLHRLRPYQQAGVRYLLRHRRALLADDMGLGKTVQAIVAASLAGCQRVLVVCPNAVVLNWEAEIWEWAGAKASLLLQAKATKTKAKKPMDTSGGGWQVMPWSQTARYRKTVKMQTLTPFDALIIDEAHYAKTPNAERTLATLGRKIKKRRSRCWASRSDRVWALTGTPVENRPIEIQPLLGALGVDFAQNREVFGERYCRRENKWSEKGYDYGGAKNLPELHTKLRYSVMLRRKVDSVLTELPKIQRQGVRLLAETDEAKAALAQEREAFSLESRKQLRQEFEKKGKLGLYLEEMSEVRKAMALAKVAPAVDFAKDMEGPTVLFCHHREVAEGLAVALDALCVHGGHSIKARKQAVATFAEGGSPFFVGTFGAIGTGVNGLQTVSRQCVHVEFPWVPGVLRQAEGRLLRMGQKKPVLSIYLAMEKSMDAYLLHTIMEKLENINVMLDGKSHTPN